MTENKQAQTDKAVSGAVDKATGRVTVYDVITGEATRVYPVDAREIVASGAGSLTPPPLPPLEEVPEDDIDPDDDAGKGDTQEGTGAGDAAEGGESKPPATNPEPAPKTKPGRKPKAKAAAEGGA